MHDLGSHEGRSADDRGGRAHGRHRAEVDQLCFAVAGAPDVGGRDVAVDEAPRMDQRKRRTDAREQRAGFAPRQGRSLAQVAPVEELHRVVGGPVVDAVVVDLDYPRVRELRQDEELPLEERDEIGPRKAVVRVELLERQVPSRRGVGDAIDLGHAAATKHGVDLKAVADPRRLNHGRPVDLRNHRRSFQGVRCNPRSILSPPAARESAPPLGGSYTSRETTTCR